MAGLLAACCTLALLLGGPVATADAATGCANADAGVGEASKRQLRKAVACLIGERRAAADRKRLRTNADLKSVAQRHTAAMIRRNCFKHQCEGETSLAVRIQRSGYLDDVARFGFAEDTGCAESPRAMVKGWMDSDFHRQNLLGSRFRNLGIGVAQGSPTKSTERRCQPEKEFLSFTAIFAWRAR